MVCLKIGGWLLCVWYRENIFSDSEAGNVSSLLVALTALMTITRPEGLGDHDYIPMEWKSGYRMLLEYKTWKRKENMFKKWNLKIYHLTYENILIP